MYFEFYNVQFDKIDKIINCAIKFHQLILILSSNNANGWSQIPFGKYLWNCIQRFSFESYLNFCKVRNSFRTFSAVDFSTRGCTQRSYILGVALRYTLSRVFLDPLFSRCCWMPLRHVGIYVCEYIFLEELWNVNKILK